MEWNNEEEKKTEASSSSKILLGIIGCLVIIIAIIAAIIIIKSNNKPEIIDTGIYVDGKMVSTITKDLLLTKADDTTYVIIEEFAKLVGYEFHLGEEYKYFTKDDKKCYVQSKNETASFYLSDNKVYKLPFNEVEKEYEEYEMKNIVRSIEGKMYAPIDMIKVAFNVDIREDDTHFLIYTLDYLVEFYDKSIQEWGYTSILEQSFQNKKTLLYGYFIVKKEEGLYRIIDINNEKEIVSDKYKAIDFFENTEEFLVTNSLGKVGIIRLDGTTKLEPIYESVSVLDKNSGLYLIKKDEKFGVVKEGDKIVIYTEYDTIGTELKNLNNTERKYLMLGELIPVCKNGLWGAFNKEGKLIIPLQYDGFGYNVTNIEIGGMKKDVKPIISIKECDGIIVKQDNKYGILSINGRKMIKISADAIYATKEEDEYEYFMLYKGIEYNVIDELVAAGIIEKKIEDDEDASVNLIINSITNTVGNNTVM